MMPSWHQLTLNDKKIIHNSKLQKPIEWRLLGRELILSIMKYTGQACASQSGLLRKLPWVRRSKMILRLNNLLGLIFLFPTLHLHYVRKTQNFSSGVWFHFLTYHLTYRLEGSFVNVVQLAKEEEERLERRKMKDRRRKMDKEKRSPKSKIGVLETEGEKICEDEGNRTRDLNLRKRALDLRHHNCRLQRDSYKILP